jgi:type II secretory pathway pseudopilin PulG
VSDRPFDQDDEAMMAADAAAAKVLATAEAAAADLAEAAKVAAADVGRNVTATATAVAEVAPPVVIAEDTARGRRSRRHLFALTGGLVGVILGVLVVVVLSFALADARKAELTATRQATTAEIRAQANAQEAAQRRDAYLACLSRNDGREDSREAFRRFGDFLDPTGVSPRRAQFAEFLATILPPLECVAPADLVGRVPSPSPTTTVVAGA